METLDEVVERLAARPLTLTQATTPRDATILQLPRTALLAGAKFPDAKFPDATWSGLLLRAGCWDESHDVSQNLSSAEGSYWHGIAHRMEPDAFNADYWFRRVGRHAIFPALHKEAAAILAESEVKWRAGASWDPALFIDWCEEARARPGSPQERIATRIQDAEWNLLIRFCIS